MSQLKQFKCPNCGANLSGEDIHFCQYCGAKIEMEEDQIDKIGRVAKEVLEKASMLTPVGAAASVANNYIEKKKAEEEANRKEREYYREHPEEEKKRDRDFFKYVFLFFGLPFIILMAVGLYFGSKGG